MPKKSSPPPPVGFGLRTGLTGRTPTKRGKGIMDYAEQFKEDLVARSLNIDGESALVLQCKFCHTSVGQRSDRIKEHLHSKKHLRLKAKSLAETQQTAVDLTEKNKSINGSMSSAASTPPPLEETPVPLPSVSQDESLISTGSELDLTHANETISWMSADLPNAALQAYNETAQMNHNLNGAYAINEANGKRSRKRKSNESSVSDQPSDFEEADKWLCIRWGGFDNNLISMFSKYRDLGLFTDCSIFCEGKSLKCHKIILCASSVHFEHVLLENSQQYQAIVMKDTRLWEMEALLDFIYRGEINLRQSQLQDFLRTAQELQIKGLVTADDAGEANNDSD